MSINETKKPKKGRPAVDSEAVNLRLTRELLDAIDIFRSGFDDIPNRPEAVRRLIQMGLTLRDRSVDLLDALEGADLLTDDRLATEAAALDEAISRKLYTRTQGRRSMTVEEINTFREAYARALEIIKADR